MYVTNHTPPTIDSNNNKFYNLFRTCFTNQFIIIIITIELQILRQCLPLDKIKYGILILMKCVIIVEIAVNNQLTNKGIKSIEFPFY